MKEVVEREFKYRMIVVKEIEKIEFDKELASYCIDDADSRMRYYFGSEDYIEGFSEYEPF